MFVTFFSTNDNLVKSSFNSTQPLKGFYKVYFAACCSFSNTNNLNLPKINKQFLTKLL